MPTHALTLRETSKLVGGTVQAKVPGVSDKMENLHLNSIFDIKLGSSINVNVFGFESYNEATLDFEYQLSCLSRSQLNRVGNIEDEKMWQPKLVMMSFIGASSDFTLLFNDHKSFKNFKIKI